METEIDGEVFGLLDCADTTDRVSETLQLIHPTTRMCVMAVPTTDRAGVQQAIKALTDDGWALKHVNDGGDTVLTKTTSRAVHAIMAADQATLTVTKGTGAPYSEGKVWFVLGNAPDEVVCNYTTNLTALDALIDEWINES